VQQVAEAGGGDPDQLRWLIVLVAALVSGGIAFLVRWWLG
jgi:hypothetical protein